MTRRPGLLIFSIVVFVFVAVHASSTTAPDGLPISRVAKILASDGNAGDEFGFSVAISGDLAIIGSPKDDDTATDSGAAYIFSRNTGGADGWGQVAKLNPADLETLDNFGFVVAISGDTAVVGSIGDDEAGAFSNSGSAYIFERNHGGPDNWGEVAKIIPSDGQADDHFGRSVAISGDTVVIGSADDDGGADSGAVYLFARDQGGINNWGEVVKLAASDAAENGDFGISLAISGTTVLVGAPGIDTPAAGGSAYIFERNSGGSEVWGETVKIQSSDGASGDGFGQHVALYGGSAVVGAPQDDDDGTNSGSAYVFARNLGGADNWGEVTKLTASDATENGGFGRSVGLGLDTVIVGATDPINGNGGAVYVFSRNMGGADNWGEIQKLGNAGGSVPNAFGVSLGISGKSIVIGDPGDLTSGSNSGAAFVFMACGAAPGEWEQSLEIYATDAASGDFFGSDAAVSGGTLIVGAPGDDDQGSYSGAAYILAQNHGGADNWGEVTKLTASDGAAGYHFGNSVSLSGDTAVVGALTESGSGTNSGAAYVFQRNIGGADNWGEVTKLTASDASAGDRFGESVAIASDFIAIGAPYDADAGSATGAAYVFARNQGGADNWGQVAKLTASDPVSYTFFGNSVAVSGDVVLIGAPQADVNGTLMGAAYIFTRNQGGADNWGQVLKIVAADGAVGDFFGRYVALDGDTAAIGAVNDDDDGSSSGSTFMFYRNQGGADSWGQVAKITASDAAASDDFGTRVGLWNDTLIVGAPGSSEELGAAFIFDRNLGGADVWGEVIKLTASDPVAWVDFGKINAIGSVGAFIGVPNDSDIEPGAGSIYLFDSKCITYDLGDAPEPSYPTLLASDGARHRMGGTVFMGAAADMDVDGQPTVDADGDDTDAEGDDEDGVTFTTIVVTGETAGVDVEASVACTLNAWIDFNDDGDWDDPGEQIFTDQALAAGVNPLLFNVPFDTHPGIDANARFRVNTAGGLGTTGEAADGEVEDHQVFIEELDFGDAPDPTFPTLLSSDGPRHIIGGPLFLGTMVDAEDDGLPTAGADGDDGDNFDDEDGLDIGMLPVGASASGTVIASAAGFLNGWIDFNSDGDWTDPGEQVFTDLPIAAGANSVSIQVPLSAVPGTPVARLRVNSAGGLSPTGLAEDGEVEDSTVLIVEFDYGDAPDPTYPTLLVSDGARHVVGSGLFLGASVDIDLDGQNTAMADGDDNDGTDDEDGIVFTSGLGTGLNASVVITASGTGLLNAWIDFNRDGDWADSGEKVFIDEALVNGTNNLSFPVPSGSTLGTTFARFRIDSSGGLSFAGSAADGEVEDYQVEIVEGSDLEIAMTASSQPAASGRPLSYTISVTNNGPLTATSVTLTDTLPAELIFVSSTPDSPDCTFASGVLTCDLGTMGVTDSSQITVETILDHPVWGSFSSSASISAAETDPIQANNSATIETLIALFVDGFESADLSAWD